MFETANSQISIEPPTIPTKEIVASACWKILIVDDEPEVHEVTELVFKEFSFEGKGLYFLRAHSFSEAKELINQHRDIAVILLDVVLHGKVSGLELIEFIRNEKGVKEGRILLRTGQPGIAPERKIIDTYDIDGYLSKADLTVDKLYTALRCGLRSYSEIQKVKNTQRKLLAVETKAEEKLYETRVEYSKLIQAEEGKYQRIMDSVKGEYFFCTYGIDGVFTHVSQTVTDLLGYSPNEYLTYYSGCFTENPINKQASVYFEDALKGNETPTYEVEIFHKDGLIHHLEVNQVPVFDNDGKVIFVEGIYHDITVQKDLLRNLEESEKRLQLTLETISDGLWDWNAKSGEVYRSAGWYQMLGYSVNDPVVGTKGNWTDLIHSDDFERVMNEFNEHLRGKTPSYQCEYRIQANNDKWLWIVDSGKVVEWDENDEPLRMVGAHRDIQQRKIAEEKLQESYEKLEIRVEERTEELLRSNEELQLEIRRRVLAEEEMTELVAILTERVKELDCLLGISKLFAEGSLTLDATLQKAVDLLPPAWQYPDITCARIRLNGNEYSACSDKDKYVKCVGSKWRQTSDIVVSGRKIGSVEIFYREEKPEEDEGPFSKEERNLINALGNLFGNIIERKEAENSLYESEEKYRLLFTNMLNGFALHEIIVDENNKPIDYVFLEVNDAFESLTGLNRADIIGKNVTEVLPGIENDPFCWIERYGNVALTGEDVRFEQYSSSLEQWYSIYVFRVKKNRFAVVFENINERKNAEKMISTLLESMVGYTGKEFFDRISEFLCTWLNSDCTIVGEIIDGEKVNALSLRLDGKKLESFSYSLPGTPCENATKKGFCSYLEGVKEQFPRDQELLQINAEGYVGIPLRDKDKKVIGVLCSLSHKHLNLPARTEELFEIIGAKAAVEIERMRGEEELKRINQSLSERVGIEVRERMKQQKLLEHQSKMAAMGEMLSAIAHQWRQPLNVIGLLTQSLQLQHEEGELNKQEVDHFVLSTMKQLEYMSHTIDDFRNFFKSSKRRSTFKVIDVINETLSLITDVLNDNHVSIEIIADEIAENTTVKNYKNELKQVLLNLINNAKDAIIERRHKQAALRRVEGEILINLFEIDNKSVLEVNDNGLGIDKDSIDKIFDPYFSTKDNSMDAGAGIGLYMSKMIIEKNMGGILKGENTENGARFTIELESYSE